MTPHPNRGKRWYTCDVQYLGADGRCWEGERGWTLADCYRSAIATAADGLADHGRPGELVTIRVRRTTHDEIERMQMEKIQ